MKRVRSSTVLLERKRPLHQRIWQNRHIYLMALLPVAFFIIFSYVPMYGIVLAWKRYTLAGIMESPWIGWTNFQRMWVTPEFFRSISNTLIISFMRIVFGFPVPIIIALLVNEIRAPKYGRAMQIIYTVPHFLSWVVVGGMVTLVLGDGGAVKALLNSISPELAENYNLLYDAGAFRWLLVITANWKEAGWATIMYLAIIAGIDQSLYESATLDGCNRFQLMWNITLPMLSGIFCIQLIMSVGSVMNGSFDQVFNMMTASTQSTGDTIDTYIYRMSFQSNVAMDYGFTTAVGLFKNVINCILLFSANVITKRLGGTTII